MVVAIGTRLEQCCRAAGVLTPEELSGQALGVHTSGVATVQGLGATMAGSAAELRFP
ncbi:hypothetical protein ACWIG5_33085 [Streptomyces lydicus]